MKQVQVLERTTLLILFVRFERPRPYKALLTRKSFNVRLAIFIVYKICVTLAKLQIAP